jgi:hypothetical protein
LDGLGERLEIDFGALQVIVVHIGQGEQRQSILGLSERADCMNAIWSWVAVALGVIDGRRDCRRRSWSATRLMPPIIPLHPRRMTPPLVL